MRRMLEYQADRIEAVLAQHKIPARVTGGTVTPRWVRFQVVPALGARIAAITGLAEEIAAALDAPAVRVARQGAAIAVEVPRDDPKPVRLLPLLEGMRNVPPVTAILGIADDGVPLLIRLPSPDVAHILVAGTTGSGKTMLLRAMVLSLAYFNPPAALTFVLIDPKGRAFADMAGLPHLARPVITDPAEAAEALGSLVRLMNSRQQTAGSRQREMDSRQQTAGNRQREMGSRQPVAGSRQPEGASLPANCSPIPTVVLVIDELADLMMVGGAEVERPLTRLLQRGREAGIHVVAATQKPTAAVIGSLIKANFPVRLVGKVVSPEDARVATGWKGSGAERLLGRGDFIAVAEGRILECFYGAYVAPEAIGEVISRMRAQGYNLEHLITGGER